MAKNCELCGRVSSDNEMLFGVWLCQECRWGYRRAMDGDYNAYTKFSNPLNFPNATETAKKEIIGIIASKKVEPPKPKAPQPPVTNTTPPPPVYSTTYPQSNTTYQQPSANYRQPQISYYPPQQPRPVQAKPFLDGLYKDIGKKIKNWAKWIFVIEAISSIIAALIMMFSGDDGLLWGFIMILAGPLLAFISTWILYAFGELVDKTIDNEKNTREILKIMSENNSK